MTYGKPISVFTQLTQVLQIKSIHTNEDYEPYAIERDKEVATFLEGQGVLFNSYKDHVIFHPKELLKSNKKPYTIYTPYKRIWKASFLKKMSAPYPCKPYLQQQLIKIKPLALLKLKEIGFQESSASFPSLHFSSHILKAYQEKRDFLAGQNSSRVGVHLRFGTISIRQATALALQFSEGWLDQLIWRNFYIMILYHFPYVVHHPFNQRYKHLTWQQSPEHFLAWCEGRTGFPLVDAGMRELNTTGLMHNRSRMIAANFLTKCLLIDWRWGEAYFAKQLLDYDLALNNGNWQWSAGTGCDATPYFRIFNPTLQLKKFDPALSYTKCWVPEYNTPAYPKPIIDYAAARKRALQFFKELFN